MKKLLFLICVLFAGLTQISAQESNVKYQEIQGRDYKFTYHENEVVKAKEHVLSQADGSYTSLDFYEFYDQNGNIIFKGNKVNGRHIEYYADGTKKVHGAVMNSNREGEWWFYSTDGTKIRTEIYKAGELIETINY